LSMTPEELARQQIDQKLSQSGWLIQDVKAINLGAAQPNLNTSIVKSIIVPLPYRQEHSIIIKEIEKLLSIISSIETTVVSNIRRSQSLRQSILKRAFAQKLVSQDPVDLPASELLERIREEKSK